MTTSIKEFLIFLLFLSLGLFTGCSERIGPSDEKVTLDVKDFINKKYQSVVQIRSFAVDEVRSPSEDRVDIDVTMVLQMDPTVEEKINQYRDPFGGYSSHPLKPYWRKAQRLNMGQDDHLTLHYQLNNKALWVPRGFSPRQP